VEAGDRLTLATAPTILMARQLAERAAVGDGGNERSRRDPPLAFTSAAGIMVIEAI
jgi:hypothetical protein